MLPSPSLFSFFHTAHVRFRERLSLSSMFLIITSVRSLLLLLLVKRINRALLFLFCLVKSRPPGRVVIPWILILITVEALYYVASRKSNGIQSTDSCRIINDYYVLKMNFFITLLPNSRFYRAFLTFFLQQKNKKGSSRCLFSPILVQALNVLR